MDAETRLAVRRAFECAHYEIGRGFENYICVAVRGDGSLRAREIVHERINPYRTLQDWVFHNVMVTPEQKMLFAYYPGPCLGLNMNDLRLHAAAEMRRYRLRWLEELIREFS